MGGDLENLDALSADGSDPASKMGESGVYLASDELTPCTRIEIFKEGNLRGAARIFLRESDVCTPACHNLMVCVQVLHVFTFNDQAIVRIPVKLGRKQARWVGVNLGHRGGSRGNCRRHRVCAGMVHHASLRAPSIKVLFR